MDRERLKQVQQTDLTESRVNQEFVDWLKNKSLNWLLVILIFLLLILGWDKLQDMRSRARSEAFFDLDSAFQPETLQVVADEHTGTGAVGEMARLRAADMHLLMIQSRRSIDDMDAVLTDEQVAEHRDKAKRLYTEVLTATEADPTRTLLAAQALFGLAALAESAGDLTQAGANYDRVATIAGATYPALADQAKARKESLAAIEGDPVIVSRDDLPTRSMIDPLLRDLLSPPDRAEESDTTGTGEES